MLLHIVIMNKIEYGRFKSAIRILLKHANDKKAKHLEQEVNFEMLIRSDSEIQRRLNLDFYDPWQIKELHFRNHHVYMLDLWTQTEKRINIINVSTRSPSSLDEKTFSDLKTEIFWCDCIAAEYDIIQGMKLLPSSQ